MNPRQLTLYDPARSLEATRVWQGIAVADQNAVVRLYAPLISRAAKQEEATNHRTEKTEE